MTRTTFHRPPSMTAIARDHSEVQPNETNPGETVSLGLALPLLFAARGPFGRIRSSGLPIEGCQSRGLPSRVVNRKCELLSNCRAGPHVPPGRGTTRCSREGGGPSSAEHLAADRMWSTRRARSCWCLSTRCPHAAASSPALTVPFPRSLPAPQVPAQQDRCGGLVHAALWSSPDLLQN